MTAREHVVYTDTGTAADRAWLRLEIDRAQENLIRAHTGLAYSIADRYYLPGGEPGDLRQEALIGLFEAARDYRPDMRAAFTSFAFLCIERQVHSAVKAAMRGKHAPLNTAASEVFLETQQGRGCPSDEIAARDEFRRLIAGIHTLSELERSAVVRYVFNGEQQDKQTDNAMMRARRKLRAAA